MSRILSTVGCVSQHALGKTPPWADPPGQTPLRADIPLARHPPGQTTPQADTPPWADPLRQPLQQIVRILLECILVVFVKKLLFTFIFLIRQLLHYHALMYRIPSREFNSYSLVELGLCNEIGSLTSYPVLMNLLTSPNTDIAFN